MGYANVFKHVTIPTLEQLEVETLPMKILESAKNERYAKSMTKPTCEPIVDTKIEPTNEPTPVPRNVKIEKLKKFL